MDYSKYYTPLSIAEALINELNINTPLKAVDICCGSCNLLYAAKERWSEIKLFGVDVSEQVANNVIFEKKDGRQFAIDHFGEFPLVVANPPFDFVDKKKQFPELFVGKFEKIKTSRLEIEMLIANLSLLKLGGTLLIILPSSFVEATSYNQIRIIIATNYYIESIIKLDEQTFGASKINSYALIIHNKPQNRHKTKIGFANSNIPTHITYTSNIDNKKVREGNWTERNENNSLSFLNIKRGNISSAFFIKRGQPILHTAKPSVNWVPSKRYISKKISPTIFAESGDIIVSRIGKSAGQWCVYSGDKIPISDCLYRIKDPDGSIIKKLNGRQFNLSQKGVATRYITISDFLFWLNSTTTEENSSLK